MTAPGSAPDSAHVPAPGSAPPPLRAERLIRGAARAGNGLIAGARVAVRVSDPEVAEPLRSALRRMGARLEREPAGPIGAGGDPASGGEADIVIGDERVGPPEIRDGSAAGRIAWARARMPATAALADELRSSGALAGARVAVSLVIEPKTAALALALRGAGAEVAVFGAASETDPAVVRELLREGLTVFAPASGPVAGSETDPDAAAVADARHAAAVLDWGPELLVDDGAHLIRLAHTERPDALVRLRGASEETTSGVRPLREMQAEGALRIPVLAANDARTKTLFDNRIGTGQSCVFAIADAVDHPALAERGLAPGVAGRCWTVLGYGPVGEGVARFAAALGARVTVVERDAVRALAALHDGFEVGEPTSVLPLADVVVSATGIRHTLDAAGFGLLRPGTVVAVAGGVDDELALDALRALGWRRGAVTGSAGEWRPPAVDASAGVALGVIVLADGGGVNYTAAEGNPVEVMDLSFATQLAALGRLSAGGLEPGVHRLGAEDEQRVARAALAARGGSAHAGAASAPRPGDAAQAWRAHRYRART
ncbi:adenosylhomocysteinase [Leucobacter weissii]|uniref:Adenosylhomocysteinase n=1 Tax=Leucobacter weissii TaxID=1983706 RepID=A0A939MLJ8_9MICO|nr:adenosylhomocysteinase [Leucobacter weissii]MBO1900862.1 adenosylhomocysteinase [Leucobacter weissii]